MNKTIATIVTALALVAASTSLLAGPDDSSDYNAGIGFAATAAFNQAVEVKDSRLIRNFGRGTSFGGGLVFEKFFTNYIGIHSGLYATSYELPVKFYFYSSVIEPPIYIKSTLRSTVINVPVSVIYSLNISFFSVNFLTGVRAFFHINPTFSNTSMNMPNFHNKISALPRINHFGFGFTGGVYFRFRLSSHIDLFFGPDATIYVTEAVKHDTDTTLLYHMNVTAGMMFRTDLFPYRQKLNPI